MPYLRFMVGMELWEICSRGAGSVAIGSLIHGVTRHLIASPGGSRRLTPHPVLEVVTAAIFAALARRIVGWTQFPAYSWFTAVGVSLASPT
jgi:hypothetical protein